MRILLSVALASLPAVSPLAQTCVYVPDNVGGTGGCNVIPFGDQNGTATWVNQKYQHLIPAASIGTAPMLIRELGFAPCASGQRTFTSLRIKMDHFAGSTLSLTFASNLSANAVTVLDVTDYTWENVASAWCPIGMQKPFLYIPPLGNLVIEVEAMGCKFPASASAGMHSFAGQQRVYAFTWTGSAPATGSQDTGAPLKVQLCTDLAWASTFGAGCVGSNSQVPLLSYSNAPKLGAVNFSIDVSQGLPATPVFITYGTTNAAPAYPIDLGIINMLGCKLYVDPTVSVPAATNASGAFSLLTPIPASPSFVGVRVLNQAFLLDPQRNGFPMSATNGGWLSIGT